VVDDLSGNDVTSSYCASQANLKEWLICTNWTTCAMLIGYTRDRRSARCDLARGHPPVVRGNDAPGRRRLRVTLQGEFVGLVTEWLADPPRPGRSWPCSGLVVCHGRFGRSL
jgi:hypothetical protein